MSEQLQTLRAAPKDEWLSLFPRYRVSRESPAPGQAPELSVWMEPISSPDLQTQVCLAHLKGPYSAAHPCGHLPWTHRSPEVGTWKGSPPWGDLS